MANSKSQAAKISIDRSWGARPLEVVCRMERSWSFRIAMMKGGWGGLHAHDAKKKSLSTERPVSFSLRQPKAKQKAQIGGGKAEILKRGGKQGRG